MKKDLIQTRNRKITKSKKKKEFNPISDFIKSDSAMRNLLQEANTLQPISSLTNRLVSGNQNYQLHPNISSNYDNQQSNNLNFGKFFSLSDNFNFENRQNSPDFHRHSHYQMRTPRIASETSLINPIDYTFSNTNQQVY